MKKYIVLSVNENNDYLYFTPLTCWAWRYFGWEPIVFYHGGKKSFANWVFVGVQPFIRYYTLDDMPGYRSDTITQISRLYAACVINDHNAYLMTCDIDMLPLSDYWKPSELGSPTVWGHDLTGFGQFPICYIGMSAENWRDVMLIDSNDYNELIKRDLDILPQAKDPDFYKYWFTDQELITKRLKIRGTSKINFINRGQGKHGYARGRVDKGHAGWVFDQPELIDAHLLQQSWQSQEKTQKIYDLLAHVWPKEDFTWFKNYTEEFKRLAR